jgi:uncharacterized protein YggT (Ycf19 family)
MPSFWSYWYFHIPNYVLAALMYTVMGRLLLGLVVPENWDNYIWRAFKRLTDPVLAVVRIITPAVLGTPVVLVFAVLWIMMLRIGYLLLLNRAGLGSVAS